MNLRRPFWRKVYQPGPHSGKIDIYMYISCFQILRTCRLEQVHCNIHTGQDRCTLGTRGLFLASRRDRLEADTPSGENRARKAPGTQGKINANRNNNDDRPNVPCNTAPFHSPKPPGLPQDCALNSGKLCLKMIQKYSRSTLLCNTQRFICSLQGVSWRDISFSYPRIYSCTCTSIPRAANVLEGPKYISGNSHTEMF